MASLHKVCYGKWKRRKKIHNCSTKSLQMCPHKRGIVTKVRITTPKKPNSAKRKVARVRLSNRYMITGKIKGRSHNLQPYSAVLISGGRYNDVPGVRYTLIKGVFDFSWKESELRKHSRSKYGISIEDLNWSILEKIRKDGYSD